MRPDKKFPHRAIEALVVILGKMTQILFQQLESSPCDSYLGKFISTSSLQHVVSYLCVETFLSAMLLLSAIDTTYPDTINLSLAVFLMLFCHCCTHGIFCNSLTHVAQYFIDVIIAV